MAINPTLRLRQTGQLALTPGLRTSIRVLQLSSPDLLAEIEAEMSENPFLRYDRPRPGGAYDIALETTADELSPRAQLRAQIRLMKAPPERIALAEYLTEELNDAGFLDRSATSIGISLDVPLVDVEAALDLLAACDPPGLGADSLASSLCVQLVALGVAPPLAARAVADMGTLADASAQKVARRFGCSLTFAENLLSALPRLTPQPLQLLETGPQTVDPPDLIVAQGPDGGLTLELADHVRPRLSLDTRLLADARSKDGTDFTRARADRAQALIRAVSRRAETLMGIGQYVLEHQSTALEDGLIALRPMRMGDVAQALDLHPATVTRAVSGKMLAAPAGVWPLRRLFSGQGGAPGRSAVSVQERIRQIIGAEEPATPLPDEEIVRQLATEGVDIARRTVAKYRQCLNIPSSAKRRKLKRQTAPGAALRRNG